MEAPCLSVPVRSGVPEATAVILYGPHDTGNDINDDECEMLEGFADHAAVAYERVITAMVRKELARLREELAKFLNSRINLPTSNFISLP